jgi:uncharacterized membrane protein
MKKRMKKMWLWILIFIMSVIVDVIFMPAWRNWFYFILRGIETISLLAAIFNFDTRKND